MLCWFSGVEGTSAVSIVVSRLAKGKSQWSEPTVVSVEVFKFPGCTAIGD